MEMEPGAPAEAIGALLHDVVEDSGGMQRAREIAQSFGPDVLRIVLPNSDTAVDPKPPWRQRKEEYLAAMADKEPDELRVSLADKLHNARAILHDLRTGREDVWARSNAGPDDARWY
jgi:(p)ppGpp synthase/HD superfamily hydrolase